MPELGRIMELGDDLRLSEYAKTMFLNMVQSAGSYPISIIRNGLFHTIFLLSTLNWFPEACLNVA